MRVCKNKTMGTCYCGFGYQCNEKPPYCDVLLIGKKNSTENFFLGLESFSSVDGVLASIEDTNIALNAQDME